MTNTQSKSRRGLLAAALILLFGAVAAVWWFGVFSRREDPRLTEVKAFQEEVAARFPTGSGPGNLLEAAERLAAVGLVLARIQQLPPHLRPEAIASGQRIMQRGLKAKVDAYFAAPPERRAALLDEQIAQIDRMKLAFATAQASLAADGELPGIGGPFGPGDGKVPVGPPPGSQEEINSWFVSEVLNRTSPEERARYADYFSAVERRRAQAGQPTLVP
jgi:hypothetical protein